MKRSSQVLFVVSSLLFIIAAVVAFVSPFAGNAAVGLIFIVIAIFDFLAAFMKPKTK